MGVMLTNNNASATVAFCRLPIGERKLPSSCQNRGRGELLETFASLYLFETGPEWHQPCLHPRPQGQLHLASFSWSDRRPPQPRPILPWLCWGRAGLPGPTHHAACHSWASWGGRGARGGGRFISLSKVRRTCLVYSCSFIVPSCRPGRINIAQLDPSLSLAFLCKTEQEFDNLCIGIQVCMICCFLLPWTGFIQEEVLKQSFAPLFEMVVERPAHMYGGVGSCTDCQVNMSDNNFCY